MINKILYVAIALVALILLISARTVAAAMDAVAVPLILVLLGLPALAGTIALVWFLWDRYEAGAERRAKRRIAEAEAELKAAEAARARRDSDIYVVTAKIDEQVHIYDRAVGYWRAAHVDARPYANGPTTYRLASDDELATWSHWHQLHGKRQTAPILPAGNTATERPPLLDLLVREYRLMLLGPSGSGKSSLLRHVVARKLEHVDQVLLLDPHGSRPKWGDAIDAVGFGENFAEIHECFRALEWQHKERIELIAEGHPERDFPVILVVIEEAQALVEHFKPLKVDIGHYIRMLLTRTRKTAIDLILVTQEATVEALGLKGYARNRKALTAVETKGRDGRGHKVDYPTVDGEIWTYDPPPYWPDTQPVGVTSDKVLLLPPPPTEQESVIIEAIQRNPGASYGTIADEIGRSKSTHTNRLIDRVIKRFGLERYEIGHEMTVK